MEPNVCIIDKYFSTLKNFGYLDYDTTICIVAYIALQELYNSYDWDEGCRKFISEYLNSLESSVCIISACAPCSSWNKKNKYSHYSTSGFPDLVQTFNENIFIREIIKAMDNYNFFVTNP